MLEKLGLPNRILALVGFPVWQAAAETAAAAQFVDADAPPPVPLMVTEDDVSPSPVRVAVLNFSSFSEKL